MKMLNACFLMTKVLTIAVQKSNNWVDKNIYSSNQITKNRKLKFDLVYCTNEQLSIQVLLVSKIILGYEEALGPKNWEVNHASKILTDNSDFGSFLFI